MHLCLSYWGLQFLITTDQRDQERGRGWKWEKKILQNWMRHIEWDIPCGIEKCSTFLPFTLAGRRGLPFCITTEREREEGRGRGWKCRKQRRGCRGLGSNHRLKYDVPVCFGGCADYSILCIKPFVPLPRTNGKTNSKYGQSVFPLSQPLWPWKTRKKVTTLTFPFHFPWPPQPWERVQAILDKLSSNLLYR